MKFKICLSWAAVAVWMLIIFGFSAQPAHESSQISHGVTKVIVDTVEKIAPSAEFDISQLNHIVRKNAHFFVYFALALLVFNAVRMHGMKGFKGFVLALCICAVYAATDEFHQSFVPGRGPQARDVLIDSSGAFLGLCIYSLFVKIKDWKKGEVSVPVGLSQSKSR